MKFLFYYGCDQTPFFLNNDGMVESSSAIPFHGIISRGLLTKLSEEDFDTELWGKYSHLINDDRCDRDPDLKRLQTYARKCAVLSFGDSAICAQKYIKQHHLKSSKDNNCICELWNIKEGHTSSVWLVIIKSTQNIQEKFIINVARDRDANLELQDTAQKMLLIAENFPKINMAKVYSIERVSLNYFNENIDVAVTRNQWIPDAYEIHCFYETEKQIKQYVLVERFLTSEELPSKIVSIYGRKFTEDETRQIKDDIAFFLANASQVVPTGVNINEGDVVWTGKKAVIVAIS
jgi:hypothetical protein